MTQSKQNSEQSITHFLVQNCEARMSRDGGVLVPHNGGEKELRTTQSYHYSEPFITIFFIKSKMARRGFLGMGWGEGNRYLTSEEGANKTHSSTILTQLITNIFQKSKITKLNIFMEWVGGGWGGIGNSVMMITANDDNDQTQNDTILAESIYFQKSEKVKNGARIHGGGTVLVFQRLHKLQQITNEFFSSKIQNNTASLEEC